MVRTARVPFGLSPAVYGCVRCPGQSPTLAQEMAACDQEHLEGIGERDGESDDERENASTKIDKGKGRERDAMPCR